MSKNFESQYYSNHLRWSQLFFLITYHSMKTNSVSIHFMYDSYMYTQAFPEKTEFTQIQLYFSLYNVSIPYFENSLRII